MRIFERRIVRFTYKIQQLSQNVLHYLCIKGHRIIRVQVDFVRRMQIKFIFQYSLSITQVVGNFYSCSTRPKWVFWLVYANNLRMIITTNCLEWDHQMINYQNILIQKAVEYFSSFCYATLVFCMAVVINCFSQIICPCWHH